MVICIRALEFVSQTGCINVPGFFSVLQMTFPLCMSKVWELTVIFVLRSVVLDYVSTHTGWFAGRSGRVLPSVNCLSGYAVFLV